MPFDLQLPITPLVSSNFP